MYPTISFRDSLQLRDNEVAVFATDYTSQPPGSSYYIGADIRSRYCCSRALIYARPQDVVVIPTSAPTEYIAWLQSVGFGNARLVDYKQDQSLLSVAELIVENPESLKKELAPIDKKPVFVPFYYGAFESQVAKELNAGYVGSAGEITESFFSKYDFKKTCTSLDIPTIQGVERHLKDIDFKIFDTLVREQSVMTGSAIVKGEFGAFGSSVFPVQLDQISQVYEKLQELDSQQILFEPLLRIDQSPNDQWVIQRDGQIARLGVSSQVVEATNFKGTHFGEKYSDDISKKVYEYSSRLVENMKEGGYKGVLGIDYIISEQSVYPIENNSRMNWSTTSFAIVDELQNKLGPLPHWKSYKVKYKPCSFSELTDHLGDLLYDGDKTRGVFIFDCDIIEENESLGAVVYAQSAQELVAVEEQLAAKGIRV